MEMNWDYIAGFLDGEGCISLIHRDDRPSRRCIAQIQIAQKEPEVLLRIAEFLKQYGITVRIYHKPNGKYKIYHLQISDLRNAQAFLSHLQSRVIVKENKITEALKLDYKIRATNLTPIEIETAKEMRQEGWAYAGIGKYLGRDPSNIRKVLVKSCHHQ